MNKITLPVIEIAKCCSTCKYTNEQAKPKPETHAAHYSVAKTERWCSLHGMPTVREGICPNYVEELKKGGAPAVKRALKQGRRLADILTIVANFDKIENAEGYFEYDFKYFFINADGHLAYKYHKDDAYDWRISCKDSDRRDYIGTMLKAINNGI